VTGSDAMLESVVARLADAVERRFFGKYRGFVVKNDDPEHLGRVRVTVPSLLGEDVVTGWAMPCVPYGGHADRGTLFVPEVGAGVWIEFEEGDLEFPVWVGTFWSRSDDGPETPKPNDAGGEEASDVQDPPTRKIIKSAAGHTIQFEDADDELRVIIVDGQNENRIVLGGEGLEIVGRNNRVVMSDDGIVIEDANGNTVTMDATSVALAQHGIAINGGAHVCLDGLIDWLMSHTHIGNMGAPCPVNPADMADLIAAKIAPDGQILSQHVTAG
jgi:uncharacterized protein involved in type VI secretion and phage assembly